MIKVIDGKRYNTDTAEYCGGESGGGYSNDLDYWSTCIYRTKKGAWFLHSTSSIRAGGDDEIRPIDTNEALSFLQTISDDDNALTTLDEYFADKIVDA